MMLGALAAALLSLPQVAEPAWILPNGWMLATRYAAGPRSRLVAIAPDGSEVRFTGDTVEGCEPLDWRRDRPPVEPLRGVVVVTLRCRDHYREIHWRPVWYRTEGDRLIAEPFPVYADVTTTHANPGDAGYGLPDGVVDGADLSYFVEVFMRHQ